MTRWQVVLSLSLSVLGCQGFSFVPPSADVAVPMVQLATTNLMSTSAALPSERELLAMSESFASSPLSLSVATTVTSAPAAATTATTAPATATPTPAAATTQEGSPAVYIADINYDGKVPKTESDEYVVVTNGSKSPVDLSGYYIYVFTSGTQGPTFTFPKDSILKPSSSVRVYTNEIHKETGGYSFGSGKAIWNNRGGLAVIRDSEGGKVGEFRYKAPALPAS